MTKRHHLSQAALLLFTVAGHAYAADESSVSIAPAKSDVLDVQVNAQRLNRARNDLLPETGSSVYRFSQSDIDNLPAGQNTPLNQVLLQAPGVASDSYGQLHVRGDHANLQYRINGIVIPELRIPVNVTADSGAT